MANRRFSDVSPGAKGGSSPGRMSMKEDRGRVNEKPAFSTGNMGKAQPRDRSAGVKRAKVHPKSEGI